MRDSVIIELSGGKLKPILALDAAGERTLRLTTIAGLQRAGKIRVFRGRGQGRNRMLREIVFRGIPPADAGKPDIDLHARYDGAGHLRLRIVVDGREFLREDLRIRRPLRVLPWILAAAAAILLIGLGYALVGQVPAGSGADPTASDRSVPAQRPAMPPVRPSPPSPAAAPPQAPAVTSTDTPAAPLTGDSSAVRIASQEATVYFDADLARVNPWAAGRLDRLIGELRSGESRILAIEGHTALFGSEAGREKLSETRARNVWDYLRAHGWNQPRDPELSGYGARRPVSRLQSEQHLNRRTVIRYTPAE